MFRGIFHRILGHLSVFQRILIPAAFLFMTGYSLIVYTSVKSLMIYHQTTIFDETVLMLDALEKQTAEQVVIGDYTLIHNLLRDRVKRGTFKRLAFTDAEGHSLVAQRQEGTIESPEWFNQWLDIPEQPISREVKIGGRLYGTISAQLSHSEFHTQTWKSTVKQIWIAVAGGILFFISVSFIIKSSLKPLRNVQEIARKTASGDISMYAQVSDGSAPEIREAITLFNEAASSIDYHLRERIKSLLLKLAEHQQHLEQTVAAFNKANAELKATLESTADGILVVDVGGKLANCNERFKELWQIPDEIIASRDDEKLLAIVLEQLCNPDEFNTRVGELYKQAGAESFDILFFKDGRVFERYSRPQYVGSQVAGRVWSFRDITRRIQTEEELKKARNAAESANRAKSAFLANMSHELRTPLNSILGFTQLMTRDNSLSDSSRKNLAIVNRSGEHLLAMINDVLDLSKIEAGKVELREESFDLPRTIEEITEMIRSRAMPKGLDVTVVLDPRIERHVRADLGKLRQILINLMGNAVKFTEVGWVALRACTTPFQDNPLRRYLELEVEDTGPGIPKEKKDAIFDPFTQVGSIKASQKGTGLGLTISRSFLSLMEGEILVESKEGKGSLFRIRVPVEVVAKETVATVDATPLSVVRLEPGQPEWRILVVEDNLENTLLMETLLTQVGFSIRKARNGMEGIKIVEAWRPHFIWIEINMPVMDGYETTRRIRSFPWGRDIVIFALTASVYSDQEESIIAAGCDGVLFKPFREREIFEAMARHLGVRYLYGNSGNESAANLSAERSYPAPAMAEISTVPAEFLERISKASIELNKKGLMAIAAELERDWGNVAAFIRKRAASYEFEAIEKLLESANGEKDP